MRGLTSTLEPINVERSAIGIEDWTNAFRLCRRLEHEHSRDRAVGAATSQPLAGDSVAIRFAP